MKYFFTSESVTEGHPDKICDKVADKILDCALAQDKDSKMAVEATIKDELILIYGEAKTKANLNYEQIARDVLKEIGVCDIKEIFVLNKFDKCDEVPLFIEGESILYSNKTGYNVDALINKIQDELLDHSNTLLSLSIPLTDGKAISILEAQGIIKAKIYMQEEIYYQAYIPNTLISNIKKYIVE